MITKWCPKYCAVFISLNGMLISSNFCLKPFNTFGVESRARQFAVVSSVNDLHELYEDRHLSKKPIVVLEEDGVGLVINLLHLPHEPFDTAYYRSPYDRFKREFDKTAHISTASPAYPNHHC